MMKQVKIYILCMLAKPKQQNSNSPTQNNRIFDHAVIASLLFINYN